jgi:hypothetical protein
VPAEFAVINGTKYVINDVLVPWLNRKKQAEDEMRGYLTQARVNRIFAAGKQHLLLNDRDGRILEQKTRDGIELVTSNFLDQYLNTVVGRLSATDFKPNFHVSDSENEEAEDIAFAINRAFGWGWDNEWFGDRKVLDLLRHLAIDGTVAIRARYDRRYGEIIGDVPYKDGTPILDSDEAAKYVAEKAGNGEYAEIRTIRSGKVCWELVTLEQMLPPPGVADPYDFPWEIIRRPVSVAEIKNRYGKLAEDVIEEEIDNIGGLTAGFTDGQPQQLKGQAMLYTGYVRPNAEFKQGQTVVFTDQALLDVRESLPLDKHPRGPRTGIHYFRWQVIPGRFVGKAFIENGIGPQKIYNKRQTQINAIIDRNMPKVFIEENSLARPRTGAPMEIVEVRPGSPLPKVEQGIEPGKWMMDDISLQVESAERALGLRQISMGSAPQGVSAYSSMALLTENDALKFDPISRDFGESMDELCWDTMEQMRNWPKDKKMEILGPTGKLEGFLFDSNTIPERYIVQRPQGGSLPRSQAAEIQKINDIWSASQGQLPLTWYVDSLNAGKPLDLPPSVSDSDLHKAELENIIIEKTGEPPPVAPYDDDIRHVEVHRAGQAEAQARLDAGDTSAEQIVQAYEAHCLEHENSARSGNLAPAPNMAPAPPTAAQQPELGPGNVPGGNQGISLLQELGG